MAFIFGGHTRVRRWQGISFVADISNVATGMHVRKKRDFGKIHLQTGLPGMGFLGFDFCRKRHPTAFRPPGNAILDIAFGPVNVLFPHKRCLGL